MKKAFRILPICFISILNPIFSVQAQETERVMRLEEIFSLADSCSLTINSALQEAKSADANIQVAKNGLLPDINFSVSATYNGNAWMSDRDFSNGQSLPLRISVINLHSSSGRLYIPEELSVMAYVVQSFMLISRN
ncbi:MAG: TolC family protein [Bacteroidales bacterium]|nr:TolC family protein [Bacteroidales bacterium]